MANYRKSFNLRNGVQVDDDNFVVNANGLVGIGTTIPTQILDVIGTTRVVGLVTASRVTSSDLLITGVGTFTSFTDGTTRISSGIVTAASGIVTYYGDGSGLINIPTSQWIDVNTGLGITSIYAAGAVGVATNYPYYYFQVGGNPDTTDGVGFNSTGGVKVSGILTASSFYGNGENITGINATNIASGTLSNERLPNSVSVGIVTATQFFSGTLVGTASTAAGITTTSTILVSGATIGVATVSNTLNVQGKIGVGTANPNNQIEVRQSGISSIHILSSTSEASLSVGRSDSFSKNIGKIRFGNSNLSYVYSTDQSLDIINYDDGNVNYYLQYASAGVGTGNFNWIYGQNPNTSLMTLTYSGKLGINQANPTNTLHVVGTSTVTGDTYVGGASTIVGSLNVGGSLSVTGSISFNTQLVGTLGVSTSTSPTSYNLQVGGDPNTTNGVGISPNGNVKVSGIVTATTISATTVNSTYANITGIITATSFGDGTGSANLSNVTTESLVTTNTASISTVFATTELVVPTYTNAEIVGLSTSTGSIVLNSDTGRFQGYDGTNWNNFY